MGKDTNDIVMVYDLIQNLCEKMLNSYGISLDVNTAIIIKKSLILSEV